MLAAMLCALSFIVGWVERHIRCQKCTLIHCVPIPLEIPILSETQHVIFSTLPHDAMTKHLEPDNADPVPATVYIYC